MKILSDFNFNELSVELANYPKFRAKQVFDAIIQAKDFEDTTLPKAMIEELKADYILKPLAIFKVLESKDGTKKYLLKLHDNDMFVWLFFLNVFEFGVSLS